MRLVMAAALVLRRGPRARARRRCLSDNSCNRCGPTRRSSASRVRPSTRRRAGSNPICRCPISRCRARRHGAGTAGVRADAGRLRARKLDRAARGAGQEAPRDAPRDARCDRAAIRRAAFGAAGDLGPRDRLRRLQAAARRAPRAGDAGLYRAAQGYVPRRVPGGAEDAAGRRAAGENAQLLGRRHGADAVPAVGVLQARGRFRRRRQGRHLDLDPGCAGLGGKAARQQGLAARRTLGLRGARSRRRRLHHRAARPRHADRRVAQARLCARLWPQARSPKN